MKLQTSIIAASLLGMTAASQAAIVVAGGNGNFESTIVTDMTYFGPSNGIYNGGFTSVDGWTHSGGSNNTFLWLFTTPNPYGPVLGTYSLNLTQGDPNYASAVSTTVTGLTVGQNYTLSFDTAVRSGTPGSPSMTVKVDGATLDTITAAVGTSYVTKSYVFTAAGPTASLLFDYAGTVNTWGFMLDNVNVVPEPSAALLGGLGLLALLRRRRP